jgi:hypothetical protein
MWDLRTASFAASNGLTSPLCLLSYSGTRLSLSVPKKAVTITCTFSPLKKSFFALVSKDEGFFELCAKGTPVRKWKSDEQQKQMAVS